MTENQRQDAFVTAARAQTMLRDFNRMRQAIRGGDIIASNDALDKCERWIDQLGVVSTHDKRDSVR